ncbi:MAG TPA: ABC transporter ATP-binding protein [Bacteroidia bacterium]|jgi:ABC-2 type transport system ATP-binding protein|nr:ABC transporter ATP-binding protein [Bacteroidia bacterium]
MIEVKDITKSYGKTQAVKGISFSIKDGECFGLLGPNGAGKSSTINMLSMLFPPDTGSITINGTDASNVNAEVKQILGIVPQEIALYEKFTAWENILFWGSIYGVSGKQLTNKAEELLKWVGLFDRRKELVKEYSGGMKRRINIACALLHSPMVLLLDEPTVGVDPQSRNLIFELIQHLNKEGMTIIYTTHYMEEAEKLCDKIGIMDNGKIIAQGTLDELKTLSAVSDMIVVDCTQTPDEKFLSDKLKTNVAVAENTVTILSNDSKKDLTSIVTTCTDAGYGITRIDIQKANLESVFLKMTGKQLRD